MESPYDPAIALSGVYPKELKTGASTGICAPISTAAGSTTAKGWKQPTCKSGEHTHTMCPPPRGTRSAVKRSEAPTLATARMDLEHVTLRERSQAREMSRTGTFTETGSGFMMDRGSRGASANGDGVYFGVMAGSRTRKRCWLHSIVNVLKTSDLFTLKLLALCQFYLNF